MNNTLECVLVALDIAEMALDRAVELAADTGQHTDLAAAISEARGLVAALQTDVNRDLGGGS